MQCQGEIPFFQNYFILHIGNSLNHLLTLCQKDSGGGSGSSHSILSFGFLWPMGILSDTKSSPF